MSLLILLLERLKTLWDDLNEEVALKRSGNQEQAQRIAQQIQIQAAQQAMPSKENLPHVNQHMNQQHFPNPRYTHIGSSNLNIEFKFSGQILSNSLDENLLFSKPLDCVSFKFLRIRSGSYHSSPLPDEI